MTGNAQQINTRTRQTADRLYQRAQAAIAYLVATKTHIFARTHLNVT